MMPEEERTGAFDPDEEFGWDADNDWPLDGDWDDDEGEE